MSDESHKSNEKSLTDGKILADSHDGVTQNESSDPKPGSKSKKKGKMDSTPKRDSKARTASAAVFFNDNKAIAGFGNSMRAVFTSIRELVENSLDASEKREITPLIKLKMRRLTKKEVNKLMGTSVVKTKETRVDFLELTCQDNGVGVSRELIPQLFGTVLAGTKYGAQQTRGRFGLGSKMVLLHAMSTLDLPIEITTRPLGEDKTYRIKLFIDLEKNAPIIHKDEVFVEGDEAYMDDYGTAIKVSFTGSWNLAKNYVREYFKQLAIITPYADIDISLPADEIGVQDNLFFKRVVDDLPKPPEVIKIHPWGTDISTFRREMSHSDDDNILDFLVNTFMGVNPASAESFLDEVGVKPTIAPSDLSSQEIRRIVHDGFTRALKESKIVKRKRDRVFKFDEPSGEALSPLGADRLRKGLEKELQPEFIEVITRPPYAYAGHPFIIEAAIGYGGGVNAAAASKGATVVENRVIYRYANRIPLIFGAGNDLITQEVNAINWSDYGLTRGTDPLAIAVSLVSTKIPFPETSKEYIASVTEISEEVKLVLMQLGRKLKTFLGRRSRRQRERQRKSRFEKFAPKTVNNLLGILEQEGMWNSTTGVTPSRIIAALSSGKPRIGSNFIPYGNKLSEAPIWSTTDTIQKLQNNNIFELSTFLRTPDKKLSTVLKWKEKQVDLVKRRTINELESKGEILDIDTEVLLKPEIERRFHKKTSDKLIELPRLSKALFRRWIRNTYDYLVSPSEKLQLVQGLFVKLMEAEKVRIVSSVAEEGDEVLLDDLTDLLDQLSDGGSTGFEAFFEDDTKELDVSVTAYEDVGPSPYLSTSENLVLSDVRPTFSDIKEFDVVKKRKVKTLFEFLLETAHPSSPLDEKTLALSMVAIFKEKLFELIATNMEIGNIKVSVAGQTWLDGYLRNAFKRRNIDSLIDLINTDDKILAEIGELQRTLYSNMMTPFIQKKGSIDINQFSTNNAKVKIKILKKAGISSIEQFLATPITELSANENLMKYFDLLVEDSKDELINFLTLQNSLGELPLIKIIPRELEDELNRLELFNTVDFLKKPIKHFVEKFRNRVIHAKQLIGCNFTGFTQSQTRLFKKLNISVLEELIYHPEAYLEEELTESEKKRLHNLINQLMKPINYLEPQLLPSIDILFDAGITNVGKFLVWPIDKLADIIDYQEEWLKLMRENFDFQDIEKNEKSIKIDLDYLSHLLNPDDIGILKEIGFTTVSESAQIKWGDIFPKNGKWEKLIEINSILMSPIKSLVDIVPDKKNKTTLNSIIMDFEKMGIENIIHLLNRTPRSISSSIKAKKKRELMEAIFIDLSSTAPEIVDSNTAIFKSIRIFNMLNTLRSPIVYLSEFSKREIEILKSVGIQTLHQLVSATSKELEDILDITDLKLGGKIKKSLLNPTGTPLFTLDSKNKMIGVISFEHEGIEYFQEEELNSLISVGFSTIESLYYISDHRTFEASGLSWDVISHFKKLLQSPLVLITWKKLIKTTVTTEEGEQEVEEAYYETFTSKELELLNKRNINRVIDFLTADNTELSNIVKWDSDLTNLRQNSVILQEAGIDLSDLEIFRSDHIEHLKEIGMVTIDDLYFTAKEDIWSSPLIPWHAIKTIKDVLHLDLINAVEELGEEMVELLTSNGIETILDLYLTGDPILEQRTGLPAERFEYLKDSLDIGELIQAFDKSLLFTPGLLYFQAMELQKHNFGKIIDIVLGDNKKIGKILGLTKKEIDYITDGINRTTIRKTEDERGVLLKEIQVFSRSDIRSISKSGIFEKNELDTLQEVIYQIDHSYFQGEDYLLEQVINLQKVSLIPLEMVGDLSKDEVNLLKKYNIYNISDALLIGYEDLPPDTKLYSALGNITNSLLDLRPFMAIGKLPANVALTKGDYDGSLLDAWMVNIEGLHPRTMKSLRSLLSIPVALTQFITLYPEITETLGDKTVGDLILEYYPDENSPEALLKSHLSSRGSLIKLLKDGSTPITLLDIQPTEFRSLYSHAISTIERLITNDPKYIMSIAGNTQKFWKDMKDIFIPEVFSARLEDIGIPFSIFSINQKQKELLEEIGVDFLDQLLFMEEIPEPLSIFYKFIFASTTFLIGTPGEKELSENLGAINIIEATLALRKNGASYELIRESLQVAWEAYNKFGIPNKLKGATDLSLYTLQDVASYVLRGGKSAKAWVSATEDMNKSLLFLPLKPSTMRKLVSEYRCSTVIDALTCPMIFGEIDNIRKSVSEGQKIPIINEIRVDLGLYKMINKSIWNRFEKLNISMQDILGSPRTISKYMGINQRFMEQARNDLKIPLSRIHLSDKQILHDLVKEHKLYFLEDIIFKLPSIHKDNKKLSKRIINDLNSEFLKIQKPIPIPEELRAQSLITFNQELTDFHALYSNSLVSAKMIKSISTNNAKLITNYILRSQVSVMCLQDVSPMEKWNLWKNGIKNVSQVLLSPFNLAYLDEFTIKRVKDFTESAMKCMERDMIDPMLSIKNAMQYLLEDSSFRYDYSIATLTESHPLLADHLSNVPDKLSLIINRKLLGTEFGNSLNLHDTVKLLNVGIMTLGDFLIYPEELNNLPLGMKTFQERLGLLLGKEDICRPAIDIKDIQLPKVLHDIMGKDHQNMLDLVIHLNRSENKYLLSELKIRIQYSSFNSSQISVLIANGYNTLLDLFYVSPNIISNLLSIPVDEVVDKLKEVNLTSISKGISTAPLQISTIQNLSSTTMSRLQEQNIHTLLDLTNTVLEGVNRSDQKYLASVMAILSSDTSSLLNLTEYTKSDFKESDRYSHFTVRDVIRNSELYSNKKLKEKLQRITEQDLTKMVDKFWKLRDLDGIVVKEENSMKENSIFSFLQLSQVSIEKLQTIGLNIDKFKTIIELINSDISQIVGLEKSHKDSASELGIISIAELLSHKNFVNIDIPIPIKIKQEVSLRKIFKESRFEILTQKNITNYGKFLNSKTAQNLFKNENSVLIEVVATLNLSIRKLPRIKPSWVNILKTNGIQRIHQYISADLQLLADLCGISYLSQENYLNALDLSNLLSSIPDTNIFSEEKDKVFFTKFGLISTSEFLDSGILDQFYKKIPLLSDRIEDYIIAFNTDLWKNSKFWSFDENIRVIMATHADKLIDLYTAKANVIQRTEIVIARDEILASILSDKLVEEVEIAKWIADPKIIKELDKLNIHTPHAWLFKNYKSLDIPRREILRRSLGHIPILTSKQVIKAYENNITHISDLFFLEDDEIASKIGISKTKISDFIENVRSIEQVEVYLPEISFFNKELQNNLITGGINSWAELIGNIRADELAKVSGITDKTRDNFISRINTPISHLLNLRKMGLSKMKKVVKTGCTSVLHLLLVGAKLQKTLSENELKIVYSNINVSDLNKGNKHVNNKLSTSAKIKVGETPEYKSAGIDSPVDIVIGGVRVTKNSKFEGGVKDWQRLGSLGIEIINFPDIVIAKFQKAKIKTVADAIVATNEQLRDLGASNKQIRDFRDSFNRKKTGAKTKATVKSNKESKKKPVKSSKKATSKKKGGKKSRSTKKKSGAKK